MRAMRSPHRDDDCPWWSLDATVQLDRTRRSGPTLSGRVRGPPAALCVLPHVARRPVGRNNSGPARVRRSSTDRFANWPICIRAMSPTRPSAKGHTTKVSAIATSCPGWGVPWYSALDSADLLLAGRWFGMQVCYLRDGDRVFETYWTSGRAAEVMAPTYGLLDRTVYGRQGDLGGISTRMAPNRLRQTAISSAPTGVRAPNGAARRGESF